MEKSILYFDNVGEQNTEAVIEAAAKGLQNFKSPILWWQAPAENRTENGRSSKGSGIKVIGISHQYGQKEKANGKWKKNTKETRSSWGVIATQSHMFSGIERSITKKFGGYSRAK